MYERFSDRLRKVMQLANKEAADMGHEYIGTEHLLLGLAKEGTGVGTSILRHYDIDYCQIRKEIRRICQDGPAMILTGKLPQTPRAKSVVERAMERAKEFGHNYVGTEHLLLGLMDEEEGVAYTILKKLGLSGKKIITFIGDTIPNSPLEREPPSCNKL